jgi:hypothetical protein
MASHTSLLASLRNVESWRVKSDAEITLLVDEDEAVQLKRGSDW